MPLLKRLRQLYYKVGPRSMTKSSNQIKTLIVRKVNYLVSYSLIYVDTVALKDKQKVWESQPIAIMARGQVGISKPFHSLFCEVEVR